MQAFDLQFDNYYLESSLYTSGRVEATVKALVAGGHTYEEGGALWLRTTELGTGDDKDRVMRKSEGGYTYFVPDVAYHKAKWERGFHRAVNIQGSDHHGTVARVRAGLQALEEGIPKDYPSYVLHKMVKVMRGGEEVKIDPVSVGQGHSQGAGHPNGEIPVIQTSSMSLHHMAMGFIGAFRFVQQARTRRRLTCFAAQANGC